MPKALDYITVDGEVVTLPHGEHDVAEVLAASEVNASKYDLVRVVAPGEIITYRTGETVVTAAGNDFVTVAISAGNS
jgi:hypothetical protein